MITRRRLLTGLGLGAAGGIGVGGYAIAEPYRLLQTRYRVKPEGWPPGLKLRLAVIADLHACDPWMSAGRIEQIVEATNAVGADAVLLLGDFLAGAKLSRLGKIVPAPVWTRILGRLRAPNGVHAILGNHDWWEEPEVQRRRKGPPSVRREIEAAGIPVYENDVIRLVKDGRPFWIAGLGDQWAFYLDRWRKPGTYDRFGYEGVDDLDGTLAKISDTAPVIMMIHEPDAFVRMPKRVSLTLAGHTHGGQVTFAGYAPIVPSRYGQRYVYGHIIENNRHLIVSGGLGCSGVPLRLGVPPEIVVVEVGA